MKGVVINPEALYSYSEIKEMLSIGRRTSERIIREKMIPKVKLGRSYLFFGFDILAFLESKKDGSLSD